jgi:hypothetical protein
VLTALTASLHACKGCTDDDAEPAVRASELSPIETKRVALLDRRAAHRIDPAKQFEKDESGVTQCVGDLDCFLLTAERCSPAVLDHAQVSSSFGVQQTISARYTIVGAGDGGCEVRREMKSLELDLAPELIVALKSQSRTDEDIAKIRDDALAKVRARNPDQVVCSFSNDEALEVALDLIDKKLESGPWHTRCEAPKAAEGEVAQDEAAQPQDGEPQPPAEAQAAPAGAAKPKVPSKSMPAVGPAQGAEAEPPR